MSNSPKVLLSIDFQDGFRDDTVVVKIDENVVFRKENMSTNLVLGLASTFKTEVKKGEVSVEVKIPTKNLERTIPLKILSEVHLGISVVDGMIDFIISKEPFTYL